MEFGCGKGSVSQRSGSGERRKKGKEAVSQVECQKRATVSAHAESEKQEQDLLLVFYDAKYLLLWIVKMKRTKVLHER